MEITRELFDQERHPRFGTANPERMRLAYWEWMVRQGHHPYSIRGQLGLEHYGGGGPDWCFDRMGATRTELADGRVVCVGGEHEDWYDPDFCIYNDVVVLGPDDRVEIYGYPKEVFPPTDFHTATLIENRIILIGCLGYREDRTPGFTPVYALDLASYRIEQVGTSGEMPGWIFKHEAELDRERQVITVRGGEVITDRGGTHPPRRNIEDYELDVRAWRWSTVTRRNWGQFSIRPADGRDFFALPDPDPIPTAETGPGGEGDLLAPGQSLGPAALLPRSVAHSDLPCDEWNCRRISVRGVPVAITVGLSEIRVIVEGELPEDLVLRVVEEVRANAGAAIRRSCVWEQA